MPRIPKPLLGLLVLFCLCGTTAAPTGAAFAQDHPAASAPRLTHLLAPVLDASAARRAQIAVQVVDVRTGEEVFAHNADRPLVPASTMKVVTSATALQALGPSYSFTTDVLTDGELKGGVLDGNLYVEGHADPTLVLEKVWRLLRDLKLDGLETVGGDLVFDPGFLTGSPLIPGWTKTHDLEQGPSYFPTVGAFGMNFGAIALVVRPAGEVGKPASVELDLPAGAYISVESELVTGPAGGRGRVSIERELLPGKMIFRLEGSVPLGADTRRYRRTVADPTALFMAVFDVLRRERGIKVLGRVRVGTVPEGADLFRQLFSPPLSSVLMDTNKYSSNFMAEMVLRTVGAETSGEGTTSGGLRAIRAYMASLGLSLDDARLVNGSGLSRDARLTPAQLNAVLLDMAADPKRGPEFVGSLSISGQDGTLIRRLLDLPARVRGKTGTLDGVHCLSGYAEAADGELYAFSFLVNGVRGSLAPVKQLHDDFLRRLLSVGADASATP